MCMTTISNKLVPVGMENSFVGRGRGVMQEVLNNRVPGFMMVKPSFTVTCSPNRSLNHQTLRVLHSDVPEQL